MVHTMTRDALGRYVREKRLAREALDPSYSLRGLAGRVGVQASFLSRVERGQAASLSEGKIRLLAAELDLDPELLLALSGKLSGRAVEAVRADPERFGRLLAGFLGAAGGDGEGGHAGDEREVGRSVLPAAEVPEEAGGMERASPKELRRLLNEVQQTARLGVWDRDLVTGRDSWSDEMYRIVGLPRQAKAPTFEAFLDIVDPEDRHLVAAAREDVLAGAEAVEYTVRVHRPDGTTRVIQARAKGDFDAEGRAKRIHGVFQDVTETRLAMDAARDMARFPEENPNPVLRVDEQGRVLLANPAGSAFLESGGVSPGQPLPESYLGHIRMALSRGEKYEFQASGGGRTLLFTAAPFVSDGYVNLYGADITRRIKAEEDLKNTRLELERKVAERTAELAEKGRRISAELALRRDVEAALRESEENSRRLLDNIGIGVKVVSPDGVVRYVNRAGLEIIGLPLDAVVDKKIQDLPVRFLDRNGLPLTPAELPPWRVALTLEPVLETVLGILGPDWSEPRWISGSAIPERDAHGGLARVVCVFRDISLERRAEALARESRERLSLAYRHFPLPTLTFAKTPADFVLSEANRAAERLYRGRLPELMGQTASSIFAEYPDLYVGLWAAFESRAQKERRLPYRPRPKGEERLCAFTFTPLPPDTVMVHAEDVTELARAAESMRQAHDQLQAVLDAMQAVVVIKDPAGRYLMVNRRHEELFGVSREVLRGKTPRDIHPPEVAAGIQAAEQQALAAPGPLTTEETVVVAGAPRVFLATKTVIRDAAGRAQALCAVAVDITDLKAVEWSLRQSEAYNRALIEAMGQGVLVLDLDGRAQALNGQAEKLFGRPRGEILGRKMTEMGSRAVRPDGSACPPERLPGLATLGDGRPVSGDVLGFLRPDDRTVWVSLDSRPLAGPDGRCYGVVVSLADITPLMTMEAALRREREVFLAALESLRCGAYFMDAAGRGLYANARFTDLTGYALSDIPDAAAWFETVYPDPAVRRRAVEEWEKGREAGQATRTFPVRSKDGRTRPLTMQASYLPDGRILVALTEAEPAV